jgi:hypothetical protein
MTYDQWLYSIAENKYPDFKYGRAHYRELGIWNDIKRIKQTI